METVIYTVQKGDTLFSIAKRYGTTVNMIARYNGIPDPDYIEAGRILRIPVSEIPAMKVEKCGRMREYTVKKGDTLSKIAVQNQVGIQRLTEVNSLTDPDDIKEGQILKIPERADEKKEYIVQKGDTLTGIAGRTDSTVRKLVEVNQIADPDVILEGESVNLSEREEEPEEAIEYEVKSGDTLWKIAEHFGVGIGYLINLNRLTTPNRLCVGQKLIIRR